MQKKGVQLTTACKTYYISVTKSSLSLLFPLSIRFTTAGFPATKVSGGTSFVTTLPAATMALSPIVTPGQITTPPPIHQSSPIVSG